jgi:biotin carboxylase
MPRPAVVFVESNTSGTGALFARAAAARRDCRLVLLTTDPSRYGYVEQEGVEAVRVDTLDFDALLATCRGLERGAGVAGITSSSEYYVATAAALARELGLPGPDPTAVEACRDKGEQCLRLAAAGVGAPGFRIVRSAAEAVAAAEALGLPAVVKPVSGTGSLGVRLCATAAEVAGAAEAILARRRNERGMALPERLLVQEFAAGAEFSVETFGREVVGITRKHLGEPPFFVEVGHDFPASLPEETARELADAALRALDALGLGWGPAHLEIKLTPGGLGPRIIEINPRLAGGFIPELVRLALGVDLVAASVAAAVGDRVELAPTPRGTASIRFLVVVEDGTFLGAEGVAAAAALPGVVDLALYPQPGAEVAMRGDFRDRVGHVIAFATLTEGAPVAAAVADAARDAVRLVVRPLAAVGA